MIDGLENTENVIKIGFLNHKVRGRIIKKIAKNFICVPVEGNTFDHL